ncbi:MAG: RsmB/NOP family class I SAM-dependent RNA methyltransferase [Candidatus Thorarchaeota archaeon]|jgi:NOL1/NOP2/sun family putative RNA methylase
MATKQLRKRAKGIADEYGYLAYMIERYLSLWGEEDTLRFIEACEKPIRTAIRVNTLKTTVDSLVSRLESKNVTMERIPWLEEGFWADFKEGTPGSLFEHMLGYYYVQGVPSMTASRVLDPQENEEVVDLAAAPGGKTTHIAQLMNNSGTVIAIDMDRRRIASLESNIQRCGVNNSIVLRGDSRKLSQMDIKPGRIMLDAPCSGEGLIPLEPSRKTSRSMADIRFCATKEDELLEAAVIGLAPGGTMVYSTCSIAPEENEYVVDGVLQRHPEMQVVEIPFEFGSPGYVEPYGVSLNSSLSQTRRFLPHLHGTEGFFICKMMKEGGST